MYLIIPDSLKGSINSEGNVYIILESVFPFSLDTVASIHGKSSRNGWYLQQLLKLYIWQVVPELMERYLVLDSDTFFLRSANKGVSAIIDNKGKIVKRLNRNEAGRIEFDVPLIKSKKIKNDLIFFVLLITYLSIFLIYKKKNAR